MTKKEFLTNFLRGMGLKVISYHGKGTATACVETPDGGTMRLAMYVNPNDICIKRALGTVFTEVPTDLIRTMNAWIAERGFENVKVTYGKHSEQSSLFALGYFLKIQFIVKPWDQAAKHMTDEEVLDDALGEQTRYKDTGNVYEDELELSQKYQAIFR